MIELICHLLGDYTLQNSWMAREKTRSSLAAAVHASVYTAVFAALIQPSFAALAVIGVTHFVIDRWALGRRLGSLTVSGGTPDFLKVWLLIIHDNTLHLAINYLSLHSLV